MATVTPPPPNAPVPPGGGASATTALILNPPPTLSSLQPGQSLNATLTAQIAQGQIQVDTALGLLTLQTGLNVPRGAQLSLLLTAQHPRPTVQITAINGQPVGAGLAAAQGATTQETAQVGQPLAAGQTVTATLLCPAQGSTTPANTQVGTGGPSPTAPSPGAAAAGPHAAGGTHATSNAPGAQGGVPAAGQGSAVQGGPGGQVGSPSSAASAAGQAAQGGGASQAQSAQGGQPSQGQVSGQISQGQQTHGQASQGQALQGQASQSQGSQGQGSGGGATTTLPAGTRFSATVQRVDAPGAALTTQSAANAKPLAQGQVISGAVSGRTQTGQPVVQTPNAPFALGAPGSLADGAKVAFRLDSLPLPPQSLDGELAALHGSGRERIGARTWQDLTDALRTLAGADPARLAQVAHNALPQPGGKLTNQMLFFLSALKGGNLRGLFGDSAMRILDTERPDITQRLGTDFQTMARLADEPQQGDWRLALIPLWTGEKLDQLRLFWRHGGGVDGEEEDDEETRFVLDVDLSRMGHLQIDGLVKAKRHHLDLIVRTDTPLPEDMRTDIAEIFETAREVAGLGGQVSFQAQPPNFVPLPEPEPGPQPPGGTGLMA